MWLSRIGEEAFDFCLSLASISIPDSVTSIGKWAFQGCMALTSISIPDSVTSIGKDCFSDCYGLSAFVVSPTHPTLETIDALISRLHYDTIIVARMDLLYRGSLMVKTEFEVITSNMVH